SEGVQDEILTRLAKIAELKVISRTSTQRFKSAPNDLRQIAQQLGVANILEGSVQKANDQVRVNVQLINALTDAHLWADTYDRKLTDIFAVETEIAKTVADVLQAKLTGSEQHVIAARPTANSEAHQLYLKGRFFWNKRTGSDLKKSIDYIEQAIAADPNYALAYAGVADGYVWLPGYTAGTPRDCYPKAKATAKKALGLDDTLAEARTSLAIAIWLYDFDSSQANREFQRAIELNPNYAIAHQQYGNITLSALGRFDAAIVEYQKARALNDDPSVLGVLARAYGLSGNKLEAEKILDQLKELSKQRYVAAYSFALVYLGLGDKEEALRWLEQSYQDRAGSDVGWIRVDPLLDPLRSDPRFEALAEKIVPAREFRGTSK